jgi:hypothetical protein
MKASLFVLLILLVTACGGEESESPQGVDENTSSEQVSAGPNYIEAGNEVCADATAALEEFEETIDPLQYEDRFPPGSLDPYGEAASKMAEILDGLAADLTSLDVPPERKVSVTQLAEYVQAEADALHEIADAAETRTELDPRVATGLSTDHFARVGIAIGAGLEECAVRYFGRSY